MHENVRTRSVAYEQGQGFDSSTRASRRASLHWACRAATQGHARAQLLLGVACENGVEGVALPDLPRAVGWFRAAAEQVCRAREIIHRRERE